MSGCQKGFPQVLVSTEVFWTRGIGDSFYCCTVWALFTARLLEKNFGSVREPITLYSLFCNIQENTFSITVIMNKKKQKMEREMQIQEGFSPGFSVNFWFLTCCTSSRYLSQHSHFKYEKKLLWYLRLMVFKLRGALVKYYRFKYVQA